MTPNLILGLAFLAYFTVCLAFGIAAFVTASRCSP